MKKNLLFRAGVASLVTATFLFACKKSSDVAVDQSKTEVSADALKSIASLGCSTDQVRKVDNGYLVEGDIVLTNENLTEASTSPNLRIAETEQYRTTNLVKNLPRTITVSVSNLPTVYST